MLNQVRVPAALLAGIAFGAVFGMPLTVGDGFSLGMRKRVYVLMAACSLAAELVAIVSSTVGIMKLSEPREMPTYASPILLLRGELQFEWIATQFNFLFGLLMFAGAIALRAVSVIDCPNLAKSVSLLFVAVALHMYGIVNKFIRTLSGCDNIAGLGWQYFKLVLHQGGFLNYASIACMVAAAYYLGKVSSHTWHVTRAAVHVACS
ncbi:unnamed protein product [Polarella glacialis]|nr:unnamed protein product [Polarella glacialis]